MPFKDRADAGRRLAAALAAYQGQDAIVLALPRGGVPVAAPIAAALRAPLDLVLARKIGVPFHPELAMGAMADGGATVIVRNEDVIKALRVTPEQFDAVCAKESAELARRRALYRGGRPPPDIAGRVAILVDDGLATGATTRAALRAVRARGPKTLVLAAPVAPPETLDALRAEADAVVCLGVHADFSAICCFYEDFHQISDREVIEALGRPGA